MSKDYKDKKSVKLNNHDFYSNRYNMQGNFSATQDQYQSQSSYEATKNNSAYMLPRGAKMTTDLFDNPTTQEVIHSMISKPDLSLNGQGFQNKFDSYSVNGFLGSLNKDIEEIDRIRNNPAIGNNNNPTTASDYERGTEVINSPLENPPNYLNKALLELRDQKSQDSLLTSNLNNSFTSTPRLMGILGQYIRPPSKIAFSDMYEASLDSILGSIIKVTKAIIIQNLGNYYHPNERVQSLVDCSFECIGFNEFARRALDYIIYGFSVGEVRWSSTLDGYQIINDVVFAPPTNIQFEIDALGRMQSALQPSLVASQYGIFQGADLDTPEGVFAIRELIPSVLPYIGVTREKLFYCAYDKEYNAYGQSTIRIAYKYYQLKQLALDLYMTALARNGAPALVAYYEQDQFKSKEQVTEFIEDVSSLEVGYTMYIPSRKGDGFEVDSLKIDSSNIGQFLDFVKYCDEMMINSMGFPASLLLESGGSFSSDTVKKETFVDMLTTYVDVFKEAIMEDMIKPMLYVNFSDEELGEGKGRYGIFETIYRESEKGEKLKDLELSINTYLVDPSSLADMNRFRKKFNLPIFKEEKDLPFNKETVRETVSGGRGVNNRDESTSPFAQNNGKPRSAND